MSSTDVKIFEKEEFGSVRVVMQGDDPWFVAKDVCDCLDLSNNRGAIASLDDDEKGVSITDTLGGQQEMSIISEADLYSLILRSRKPEAKAFKRWVTHEVLPSIRKTGGYSTTLPDFANPAEAARAWADEYEKNLALTAAEHGIRGFPRMFKTNTLKFCLLGPKAGNDPSPMLEGVSCRRHRSYLSELLTADRRARN